MQAQRLIALFLAGLLTTLTLPAFAQVGVGVGVRVGDAQVNVAVESDDDDDAEPAVITVENFFEPLEPYGRWIETVRFGWVWHPESMPGDWRPYSYGHWECTEMGWMFVSEHPWGWACYHYGRWLDTHDNGWIWIPGTVWAPAWVAWRAGGEHIGWAPLPPDPHYHHASTVIVEERHFSFDFVFVHGRRFQEPARPAIFVPRAQQVNIIKQTNNITQVNVVNNTVINNGPQITQVQKIVNKPVNVVKVKDVQKTEINNYHKDVAKTAPEKAEKLAQTTAAVQKSTNARVKKVERESAEVRERAAMAVRKADDDHRDAGRRGRRDSHDDAAAPPARSGKKDRDETDRDERRGRPEPTRVAAPAGGSASHPERLDSPDKPRTPAPIQPQLPEAKRTRAHEPSDTAADPAHDRKHDRPGKSDRTPSMKGSVPSPSSAGTLRPPTVIPQVPSSGSAKKVADKPDRDSPENRRKPSDAAKSGRMPLPAKNAAPGKKDSRRGGQEEDEERKDKKKPRDQPPG
jgi:hypothetical protein